MKTEIFRLNDQLKRSFDGEAWHGPALMELLNGVTVAMAVAHPMQNAHSIWEIVAHIAGWEGVILRRLAGEDVTEPAEGDFPAPPANASESDWQALISRAKEHHKRLTDAVADLEEAKFHQRVGDKPYHNWFMLHGAVSHVLYHAGQIAILKKALGN